MELIALLAFSFYVLEAVILYYPRFYWYEEDYRWYLVASSYLIFFSAYWLIFRSISAIVEKLEGQERERILAQQNKMWEEQIEEQKNAVNAARRDRHDLRHHCDTLLAMLAGGKTQEAVLFKCTDSENGKSCSRQCVPACCGECHLVKVDREGKGERNQNRSRCEDSRESSDG